VSNQLALEFDDESQRSVYLASATLAPPTQHISRPIHYLGSKLRLINLICDIIDKVDPGGGPVCDLFAGSGTVSRALSNNRDVIAVDIQEYSRVLCSALLQPPSLGEDAIDRFMKSVRSSEHAEELSWAVKPLVDYEANCFNHAIDGNLEPLCDFLEYGSLIAWDQNACGSTDTLLHAALADTSARLQKACLINNPRALATRYFGGIYFSFSQASQIDMLLEAISLLPLTQKDSFVAALLSTASEVVNTIGKQFAQPIRPRSSDGKPKSNLFRLVTRDRFVDVIKVYENWLTRYLSIPKTGRSHRIIRKDFAESLEDLAGTVGVIYADPPYTRDHYSRFYHVLETLCFRDSPTISTVRVNGRDQISRGMYRVERHQSPFCIKSQAPDAFSTLFSKAHPLGVPLVLSYSPYQKESGARPRLMTIRQIVDLAKKLFTTVEVIPAGRIAHNKLNNSEKNVRASYDAEVLVICQP
jgi:adenine-specific DNA methylase